MIEPQNRHYPDYTYLEECARGHEQAVIFDDEYKIEELSNADKDIKYIVDLGANLGTASFQFQKFFSGFIKQRQCGKRGNNRYEHIQFCDEKQEGKREAQGEEEEFTLTISVDRFC